MKPRLKLFTGEDCEATPPPVSISFGELRRIIEEATGSQRSWLKDFSNQDVQVPEDLYDVLTGYERLRSGA